MIDFEAHAADSAARQEADDFVLANFSFISAYTDVLRAVLCRDASVDILVLLESDCHPDANVVLSVADLADIWGGSFLPWGSESIGPPQG